MSPSVSVTSRAPGRAANSVWLYGLPHLVDPGATPGGIEQVVLVIHRQCKFLTNLHRIFSLHCCSAKFRQTEVANHGKHPHPSQMALKVCWREEWFQ